MTNHVVIIDDNGVVQKRFSPVPPKKQFFTEPFLQKLIFEEPKLLSSEEIGYEFTELIARCLVPKMVKNGYKSDFAY